MDLMTSRQQRLDQIYKKVSWRLLPFLLLCYFFAYLDRINIGFAKLQMQQELGFNDAIYGMAAGIFFLGYVLFEVPTNLYFEKVGARKTITRIMILWGLTSMSMLFVTTPQMFYVLRFLLGVFEAGFAPGMIFYLTLLVFRCTHGTCDGDRHAGRATRWYVRCTITHANHEYFSSDL